MEVIRSEDGGDAAAHATHGAVAVHLAVAGIHVAEVALAIDNLTNQVKFAQVFRYRLILLSATEHGNRTARQRDHFLVTSVNQPSS